MLRPSLLFLAFPFFSVLAMHCLPLPAIWMWSMYPCAVEYVCNSKSHTCMLCTYAVHVWAGGCVLLCVFRVCSILFSLQKGIFLIVFLPSQLFAKESNTKPLMFSVIMHPLNHRMDRREQCLPLPPCDYSVLSTAHSHGAEIRGKQLWWQ